MQNVVFVSHCLVFLCLLSICLSFHCAQQSSVTVIMITAQTCHILQSRLEVVSVCVSVFRK